MTKGRGAGFVAPSFASGQFEILIVSSLVDGVVPSTSSGQALSVAVLQADPRISRYDTVYHGDPSARW